MFSNHEVRRLLRSQDGVISRAQGRECGLSDRQIDFSLTTGQLEPLLSGVFLSSAQSPTPRSLVYAGSLRSNRAGVLINGSAAWWLGLPIERPNVIEFSTPTKLVSHHRGVRFRRIYVDPLDQIEHDGIRVQTKPLAAIRAAAAMEVARHGDGLTFLDRCIQLGVRRDDMIGAVDRHKFCAGNLLGRFLLDITSDGAASAAERKAGRLLHQAGITGWKFNVRVRLRKRTVVIDICFGALKIAIEIDGFAFHSGAENFVTDRHRLNALRADGWLVIQVTWHDLVADPERFIEEVRGAIAGRTEILVG